MVSVSVSTHTGIGKKKMVLIIPIINQNAMFSVYIADGPIEHIAKKMFEENWTDLGFG